MLIELRIEDLGVISSLGLVFGSGLTVFTGETGAGKTMLIDAINLLVGGRADATMVRSGATEARVEGRFDDGDDEYVLARVIPVVGRSRAYVNGRLATVSGLAELGSRLVDIHGQHAHQTLLGSATQRDALDRFGAIDLTPLRAARAKLTEIAAAMAALGGDLRTRAREIDLLRFQLDELVTADLGDAQEDAELERLEAVFSGAQAHREAAAVAVAALVGTPIDRADDSIGAGGALDSINAALVALGTRRVFADVAERLRSLAVEVGDVISDLRDRIESIDDDPARLAVVVERRHLLRTLRRKYGETLADVIEFREQAAERLSELEGYDVAVERLERERDAALEAQRSAAAVVGAGRRRVAGSLAADVQARLRELAMPRAEVVITVGDDDPGDDVTFLLAANPGSPPLPLTRVASGGELARTMLALRLVLTERPSTLVFDEVDAGIGGAAATAVGKSLAALGTRHQVFVVTHLAQVAALAQTHVNVAKEVLGERTIASATVLGDEERIAEIARMLSGLPDSTSAREHALELLSSGGRA